LLEPLDKLVCPALSAHGLQLILALDAVIIAQRTYVLLTTVARIEFAFLVTRLHFADQLCGSLTPQKVAVIEIAAERAIELFPETLRAQPVMLSSPVEPRSTW
jgi:hypothetical protein